MPDRYEVDDVESCLDRARKAFADGDTARARRNAEAAAILIEQIEDDEAAKMQAPYTS